MMVRLEDVSKGYGSGANAIRALDQVSLGVGSGEFIVLTGPSGSGKTTLLNLIGGLTRPDHGQILVAGQDLLAMPDAELSHFRGRSIGFVFQFQSMLPTLTALDNVRLPRRFAGGPDDEPGARELLAAVGLADRAGAYVHELSAGQQRRVGIARALVNKPALLLCDEPTGDLDPDTEAVIMAMIAKANREGATVLMTTHNQALSSYASRSLRLEDGRLLDTGTKINYKINQGETSN